MKRLCLASCALLALCGCRQDMFNQPRYKTFAEDDFFPDGTSARPIPPHTVARGQADVDTEYYAGTTGDGKLVETLPQPVTGAMLERGRERFEIYCAECHGRTGDGNGMIVQRGFPAPPSYHSDRLRKAPIGYFYYVITNGYGVMYPYASRVAPADRWAIAAYIRALQLSHDAKLSDVPADEQAKLQVQ